MNHSAAMEFTLCVAVYGYSFILPTMRVYSLGPLKRVLWLTYLQ